MVDTHNNEHKVLLSAIQLCSKPDVLTNVQAIEGQLKKLTSNFVPSERKQYTHLVVLPECCLFFGGKESQQLTLAKNEQALIKLLAELASKYQLYLVAGTVPKLASSGEKFYNSSVVFSPNGAVLAQYDKIHLFDVQVKDKEKNYQESKLTEAGTHVALTKLPFAKLGLTVCYDIRFPELYRYLTTLGADIITVPSAFTRVTGKAHWQTLLQARAIENQVYIIAAAQEGVHDNGRETWGHSMIISPWGEILAHIDQGEGLITAEFSLDEIKRVRQSIPVHEHNQFSSVPLF